MMIGKYIGRTVDIIYLDRTGKITKRRIQVWSVDHGLVKFGTMIMSGSTGKNSPYAEAPLRGIYL